MHKILKKIFSLSDEASRTYTKAGLMTCLFNLARTLPIVLFALMLDEMLRNYSSGTKSYFSLVLYMSIGAVLLLIIFLVYWKAYKYKYLGSGDEDYKLRLAIAEKIRKLPMSYLGKRDLSDLNSIVMDDVQIVQNTLAVDMSDLIGESLFAIITLVTLVFYNWRMTLVLAACIPAAILFMSILRLISDGTNRRNRSKKLAISECIQEYLENIQVLQASKQKNKYEKKISKKIHKVVSGLLVYEFLSGFSIASAENILRSGIGFVIIAGSAMLAKGQCSVLCLLVFLLASSRLYEPLCHVCEKIGFIVHSLVASGRIHSLLEHPEQEGEKDVALENFDIEFENVSFAYNNDDVLHDVSFCAKQGEITALIGPSGCGKSTICRLAARFWDVSRGTVKVGGKDVSSIDPETLMKNISFVFQDVILFNDTIYNNIKIGNENATEEEVLAAAKMSRCDDFVQKFSDGYNTVIGENGKTLSGGERQRLSIARAFLKNAPIILLDESTASLDPENETKIQEAIGKLIEDKTVLIIAHRLRSITDCDKIVVLKEGRIEEYGTHNVLMQNNGLYNRLFTLQTKSTNWSV